MKMLYCLLISLICLPIFAHEVGEYYQGGVIFYVEHTDDVERGLIAADSDQSDGIKWSSRLIEVNAYRNGFGAGKDNTTNILNVVGPIGEYAARYSTTWVGGGLANWYLPSMYELELMYKQQDLIGEFYLDNNSDNYYWSSTSELPMKAWAKSFSTGESKAFNLSDKKNAKVRLVRYYQVIKTSVECSIVNGIIDNSMYNKKWNVEFQYIPETLYYYSSIDKSTNQEPVFKCTVKNGSAKININYDQKDKYYIDGLDNNEPLREVTLTNETRYFYGVIDRSYKLNHNLNIEINFIRPSLDI